MKVILNVAMTLDGKIDSVARQGASISSEDDWERVDRLRAAQDAIIVGGRTLLDDDPRLLVKSDSLRAERVAIGSSPNPAKVGIISNATLSVKSRFMTAGEATIIIFTSRRTSETQLTTLRDAGAQVFVLGESRVNLAAAMETLAEQGIEKVLVEGGGSLNAALLAKGLVDEVQVYIAPLIFGGATAPTLADGDGILMDVKLDLLSVDKLNDGGVLLKYRVD
ncbi:MAG: 2,5-diamino-6-(ribosylamino)-4(3H)-pyrimidinone 5'-phosphate reductase [Anaerolineales bacterium]|uniref:2,5-diamino-6-(ribosylamino)-4(3H)-pyrimidinone 5'-phosphate reductase n=1 Tax=Candidatus Desulfolinea nitratireducens TaxID=2841698 RepID=A0A8J6NKC5_9CHLR|nr:2,5-diamino-6-(ribosylamino)-4(3H)-pyrimidinone 5'-phosphate reductase [Candidatus Desulfolinea nitratireducens]MBL6960398.1 2,5-diamino-6-(ribosylamino)-4(3H)-pyrimidinone 5'-phosphate reductase [Anaerolineales bacterium]